MENSCPRGLKIKLSHRLQHLIRIQALESSDLKGELRALLSHQQEMSFSFMSGCYLCF